MTSVVGVLLVVCVGLFAAGLIGRSGTESLAEIDANVAATMAMLVVFSFLLLSFSSLSELAQIFSEYAEEFHICLILLTMVHWQPCSILLR